MRYRRELVEVHLTVRTEAARRRAVEAIGGFLSGSRDVSERHDDYLAEDLAG